jgi:hypothetical protein
LPTTANASLKSHIRSLEQTLMKKLGLRSSSTQDSMSSSNFFKLNQKYAPNIALKQTFYQGNTKDPLLYGNHQRYQSYDNHPSHMMEPSYKDEFNQVGYYDFLT